MAELNACPGCGATWSCGGGCPIWGYGGSGWKWLKEIDELRERLKKLSPMELEVLLAEYTDDHENGDESAAAKATEVEREIEKRRHG